MTLRASTRSSPLSGLLNGWQSWWVDTTALGRLRVQLATLIVVGVVAYHYSLSTLLTDLSLSTPLAYVGLVPAIALCVAGLKSREGQGGPDINDRHLDWIIGIPLIGAAVVIELLVPRRVSALFWVWRLDLLSFPFFIAGAVALLFGSRTLWKQRFALAYLLLGWPLPYTLVLLKVLNDFTNLTLSAIQTIVAVVPVATPQSSSDGSVFLVTHNHNAFPLSVVSACSGVDSVVGFLLVGSAFAAIVRGNRVVKGVWLIGGMILLWLINLGRILFIFWAGRQWGEHIAINILHPFIGLVTFGVGIVIMILVMPKFHLTLAGASRPVLPRSTPVPAVRSILPAVGILVAVSLVLGTNNNTLKAYDLVANAAGEPKMASFISAPSAPDGWSAQYLTAYTWAKAYFGESSSWERFTFYRHSSSGALSASVPIVADVINTTDLTSFSAYGVEDCYNFHNYVMRSVANVSLTGGITGQAISYTTGHNGSWSIVYWIMPVKGNSGSIHYERVILYIQNDQYTTVSYPGEPTTFHNLQGSLNPNNRDDARLIQERGFLVAFGRDIIVNQGKNQAGTGSSVVASQPPLAPRGRGA